MQKIKNVSKSKKSRGKRKETNILEYDMESEQGKIASKINHRRRQMLVHSFIYYRLGTSIVTDRQFDKWAYELAELQNKYPDIANNCIEAKAFAEFDGTTGFDLPQYGWIERKAQEIIYYHKNKA